MLRRGCHYISFDILVVGLVFVVAYFTISRGFKSAVILRQKMAIIEKVIFPIGLPFLKTDFAEKK